MMRFYNLFFGVMLILLGGTVMAQRIVDIPPSDDPTSPADISLVIMGDTMPTGERMDNNTVYRLANGSVYTVTSRLENTEDWPLQIEAADLTKTAQIDKPVITRTPNADGAYPQVIWSSGDVTLKNLWIIGGETGPGEQQSWGQCRFFGTGSRVIVTDCLMEKDRGGFLQLRANDMKIYVDNCVFRNGGNRFILEGNGRGIDTREFAVDTLIVRNTVIHNIIDRVFRSLGNVTPHNYIEFDHCTVFNHFGRHGCFVFEQAHNIKITNNLLINPNMMGASPRYADEQNNPDNEVNKIFTLDTLVDPTNVTISNNNIFWTEDVKAVWAKYDTVSKPPVYSTLIQQAMGDTTNGYFTEELELNSVPINITEYLDDLYANPAAEDMFDFVVQDSALQGTARDFGNLFDFLGIADGMGDFSPCYDVNNTMSGTAATDGGPIGALTICGLETTSVYERAIDLNLNFGASPNPISTSANFAYHLDRPGLVRLSIYDLTGRTVQVLVNDFQSDGDYNFEWRVPAQMPLGTYIARLQTQQGQMATKLMLTK
ncbi:MAG: T9SS type A sorting domain-containing protein [Saprospiraceae bacterium]|nr:T9SS type A sorting domain-containing protein [Saprospiraceae bacterium]